MAVFDTTVLLVVLSFDTTIVTEDIVVSFETEVALLLSVDLFEDIVFFNVVEVVVFTEDFSVLVITGAVDNAVELVSAVVSVAVMRSGGFGSLLGLGIDDEKCHIPTPVIITAHIPETVYEIWRILAAFFLFCSIN